MKLIMCWIKENIELKKAKSDIQIFKIMKLRWDNQLVSLIRDYVYQLNELVQSPIETGRGYIDIALHSYSKKIVNFEILNDNNIRSIILFKSYLFGFKRKRIGCYREGFSKTCIVEGFIPKGSTYDINHSGECVSDQIVLNKIITVI